MVILILTTGELILVRFGHLFMSLCNLYCVVLNISVDLFGITLKNAAFCGKFCQFF